MVGARGRGAGARRGPTAAAAPARSAARRLTRGGPSGRRGAAPAGSGTDVADPRAAPGPRLPRDQLLLERRSRPPAGADPGRAVRGMKPGARAVHCHGPAGRRAASRARSALPVWAVRALAAAGGVVAGVLILASLAFYGPSPARRRAGPRPRARRGRASRPRTRRSSTSGRGRSTALEQRYAQVRQMVGADIVPDPLRLAATLPVAPADPSRPRPRRRRGSWPATRRRTTGRSTAPAS